jgi:hypothetical protein
MHKARSASPIILVFCALLATPVAAEGLEGRWLMVEQYYGDGQANIADKDLPLYLEFTPEGEGWSVLVWPGDDRDKAVQWPAHVTRHGIRPVELLEREILRGGGGIRVKYELPPQGGGTVVIEEKYSLDPSGEYLTGKATVHILQDGQDKGTYVLNRRFERAR